MDISQIQIVPVDNGFFIQCVNADGSGSLNPRRVAKDRAELVKQIKELAEHLYTKEAPKPGALFTPPTTGTDQPTSPVEEPKPKV